MASDSFAGQAGAGIHNALAGMSLPGLVGLANPVVGTALKAAGPMADFFHGLVTGHAIGQNPVSQVGDVRKGSITVDVPAASGTPKFTQAFLDAQPNFVQQAAAASGAKADTSSSKTKASPMDEAVARFAQANGGISLNELAALSHSMAETSPLRTQAKDPSSKDVAGQTLMGMADQMYTGKMLQAQALKGKDDAAAAKLQDEAVKERMDTLKAILGANPVDLQTAAAMGGTGGE